VYIKSYGGNYSLNTISLNGLGAEHTLVLLNGFKMNSTQNNLIDLNTLSKDNIERIEILNNGSSSIYGSEAMGGVINVITKNNSVKDLNIKLNGQVGSYDLRKLYLSLEKSINKFNLNFNISKESSLNNYQYYYSNGLSKLLKERENSRYDFSNYSVSINYLLNKHSKLNYFSNYSEQSRSIPGIEAGSAPASTIQDDKNWNGILTYENILSNNVSVKSQINFQNNLSDYYDMIVSDSYYKNIYLSNLSQINYIKNNFELVSGYEINYAGLESNEIEDNADRIQPGIFIVSKINASDVLKFYPSVRYDYISDITKSVVSGMIGLNIRPIRNSELNFKANAGNNFAAPTFKELYWKDIGNTDLKPESSLNIDAGVIYGFNLFSDNSVELTYSYIDAKDKIVWSPNSNGLWTPKNIGKSESNVILFEANLNKEFSNNLNAYINFNYSYTQSLKKSQDFEGDPSFDKQIFYIPQELAKCNVNLKYGNTGINLFYTFTGKRYTNFENTKYLKAVDLFEGNVFQNFKLSKINTQIKFEVNNIFNEDYQILSGYPMPLRNYKLSLSLEY
jgi:iron complex outermembrane receptor protein